MKFRHLELIPLLIESAGRTAVFFKRTFIREAIERGKKAVQAVI